MDLVSVINVYIFIYLAEITTFCIVINFELLVDHGFINHWLLLLLR